jgi:outer membrane protein TolC
VSLRAATARITTLTRAAQAAEAATKLSQVQRDAGLLALDDLLSAQRSALSAQLSLQSARSAQSLALVQLFKALGGPVESSLVSP